MLTKLQKALYSARYFIFINLIFVAIMMAKKAFTAVLFAVCAVLFAGCRTQLTALEDTGLYVVTDRDTGLCGLANTDGRMVIPPYALSISSAKDVLICLSPDEYRMVYDLDGVPVFFTEFDYVLPEKDCLRCFVGGEMYVYLFDYGWPLGPLPTGDVSVVGDTLVLQCNYGTARIRLGYPDAEPLFYNEPLGWERSVIVMDCEHCFYAGMARGDAYYAMRPVSGKKLKADEMAVYCHSRHNLAVGEELHGEWTFYVPSTDSTLAAVTEVPNDSWLVYDRLLGRDFLIMPRGNKMEIAEIDGQPVRELSAKEWRRVCRKLDNKCQLGTLNIGEAEALPLE